MKFTGKSLVILCAFTALTSNTFASVFTFGELLLKPVSIKSKIVKEGVSGASVTSLKQSIDNSISSITGNNVSLREGLASLKVKVPAEDSAKIGRIMAAIDMPHDAINGQRFKDIINDLAYISSVYGSRTDNILNCAFCRSDQLASLGFKSKVVTIADPNLKKLASRLPYESLALNRKIATMSRNSRIKDVSRYLDKSERRVLALFLSFNDRGVKKEYKDFFEAVTKFNSAKNGEVVLAGPTAKSQFWKVIDGKFSPDRAARLAQAISEASKKPVSQRENEFYAQLLKLSDKTPEAKASIEELRAKKCFFK